MSIDTAASAHVRTDPACREHDGNTPTASRGIVCRVCVQPRAAMDPATTLALLDELDTLRDTLAHRSDALNRVAAENDQLRARLARIETLADQWAVAAADRRRLSEEGWQPVMADIYQSRAEDLRDVLDEP